MPRQNDLRLMLRVECHLSAAYQKQPAARSRAHGESRTVAEFAGFQRRTAAFEAGGRSWIRTSEGVSQQIYSLPPLATWVSYRRAGMWI